MNCKRYIAILFLTISMLSLNFFCIKSFALKNENEIHVHRLYNPNSGEHFYTTDATEKNYLVSLGWNYENIGWISPVKSNTPIYRLYNPNAGDHHYTKDENEKNYLVSLGWQFEGIGWYGSEQKTVPIYRQYNPNAIAGAHNFTRNKNEDDYLGSVGWHREGIAWYALEYDYVSEIYEKAPAEYAEQLKLIKANHPNFVFEFKEVEPDFSSVLAGESVHGRSLIWQNPPSSIFCSTNDSSYNPYTNTWSPIDGLRWYQANEKTIAYYLDPRNYLTENRIYAFLKISDVQNATLEGCEDMLKGTFMDNVRTNLPDGSYKSYAEIFYQTGKEIGVSPYFLISKVIQEVGRGGSRSTSGSDSMYPGIYNFYNIHAYSGSDPVTTGLSWAAGSGSVERPWDSQYKSIHGGALWIAKGYIDRAQDTIYFMKFDVVDNPLNKNGFYAHQYMTNIKGAVSEGNLLKRGYENSGADKKDITFLIPVYKNLPSSVCEYPG